MTGAPWWASEDADDLDRHEDPLRAHLDARGVGRPGGAAGDEEVGDDDGSAGDEPPDAGSPDGSASRWDATHGPAICGVCPICRGWAAVVEHRPEVTVHLADAARALATALTHLADAAAAAGEGAGDAPADEPGTSPSGPETSTGFRPILLDDPAEEADETAPQDGDDRPGIDEETA